MRGQRVYYTLVYVHLNITVYLPHTRLRPRLPVAALFRHSSRRCNQALSASKLANLQCFLTNFPVWRQKYLAYENNRSIHCWFTDCHCMGTEG